MGSPCSPTVQWSDMSGVSLPVTRPPGRALIVGQPAFRSGPASALQRRGYVCTEVDEPYDAMVQLCRRPLFYSAVILSLNSLYGRNWRSFPASRGGFRTWTSGYRTQTADKRPWRRRCDSGRMDCYPRTACTASPGLDREANRPQQHMEIFSRLSGRRPGRRRCRAAAAC